MNIKVIFVDFYGTMVAEDDNVIGEICRRIAFKAAYKVCAEDVGRYWWERFTGLMRKSSGDNYMSQEEIESISLGETIKRFKSCEDAMELEQLIYGYWEKPEIFEDTVTFMDQVCTPVFIVSNIDRKYIVSAMKHLDICADGIITSEDARCYKPDAGIFKYALDVAGASRDEAIHIGDSMTCDIEGAYNAGIMAIWLDRKTRGRIEDNKAAAVCGTFADIIDILRPFGLING